MALNFVLDVALEHRVHAEEEVEADAGELRTVRLGEGEDVGAGSRVGRGGTWEERFRGSRFSPDFRRGARSRGSTVGTLTGGFGSDTFVPL